MPRILLLLALLSAHPQPAFGAPSQGAQRQPEKLFANRRISKCLVLRCFPESPVAGKAIDAAEAILIRRTF
jgi:hypothetical protein